MTKKLESIRERGYSDDHLASQFVNQVALGVQ